MLPLQWFGIASTPLGEGRVHQLAMLSFAFCVFVHYRLRAHTAVARSAFVFIVANAYMIAAVAALSLYHGQAPNPAYQQLLYLGVFGAVATYFYRAASNLEPGGVEILRWASAATCVSALVGFGVSMAINGVNPGAIMAQTIASGDPELFQKEVFKSAFAGFGLSEDIVQGNLRHEVFGAVLLAMLVSTWAMRVGSAPTKRQVAIYRAATLTGVALLAISLSRSVIIAALILPVLAIIRSARRGELSTAQLVIFFGSAAAVGVLLVSGLGLVIVNRFLNDTTGYESRAGNYDKALAAVPDYWVTGGYDTSGVSSHNFLLDTLLRNGVFAFIPAVVIVGVVLVTFAMLATRLYRLPTFMVPVAAALALPLVRMGTSGGGLIPPVEWLALGFAAGVLAAWRRPPRHQHPPAPVRVAAHV